jgi:hypothetical protein
MRGGGESEEEDLYFEESEEEEDILNNESEEGNTEGKETLGTEAEEDEEERTTVIKKKMTVTTENLPFGHICDDIAVDNDTPYIRLYCQNVCGIFDREGIGLDSAFREIKQAGADIFTFNETHGDESNATARRALRLSKQRMWRDNNEDYPFVIGGNSTTLHQTGRQHGRNNRITCRKNTRYNNRSVWEVEWIYTNRERQ